MGTWDRIDAVIRFHESVECSICIAAGEPAQETPCLIIITGSEEDLYICERHTRSIADLLAISRADITLRRERVEEMIRVRELKA